MIHVKRNRDGGFSLHNAQEIVLVEIPRVKKFLDLSKSGENGVFIAFWIFTGVGIRKVLFLVGYVIILYLIIFYYYRYLCGIFWKGKADREK
jgi:hypothetical protein